jgi:hypothetical protein
MLVVKTSFSGSKFVVFHTKPYLLGISYFLVSSKGHFH